ncbi:MAG: ATPase [Salaquimonas sp.]|nr:ATPase [Salaquimonas sp.]
MRDLMEQLGEEKVNPMRAAEAAMRQQLPKRFYKQAEVAPVEGGFAVQLDGRPVRTPGRKPLEFESKAVAEIVAAEWQTQDKVIDPATMPATRLVNTALDGVATDPQAVIEDILKYAASDLLCYRAGSPQGLVERQNAAWDPVVDWLRDEVGANFVLGEGVMHVAQPREAVAAFGTRLRLHCDALAAACLHTFTTLTGSAFLALAIAENRLSAEEAWEAAHVDEDWNISLWGEDGEAMARRSRRWLEMKAAADILAVRTV